MQQSRHQHLLLHLTSLHTQSFSDLPSLAGFVSTSTLSTYITNTQLASALSAIASSSANGTLLAGGTLSGNLIPAGDNLFTLGTPTERLSAIYANKVIAGDLGFAETNSAVSGAPINAGDFDLLYVKSTGGACTAGQSGTCTVPVSLNTALNTNNWGSNNIFLNTSGSLGLGIASTTAPKAKLDVEGNYASGNSSLLTLANLSGANGNAAIPYSFYIPSNTGDLNIASNDTGTGSLINNSYPAWDFQLGGQSDAFSLKRSAPGTQAYTSVFNISNTGNLSIPGNLSIGGTFATGQLQFTNASTSQFSVFNNAYFGATATTTIDAAGNIIGAGTLSAGTSTLTNLIVSNLSTSTFAGGLQAFALNVTGTATSTFSNGIQLNAGCLLYNNKCLTPSVGTTGQIPYFSSTNNEVGTSTLTLSATGFFGIGTSSPLAALSIQGTPGSTDIFDVASSTGANVLKVDSTGALTAKLKQLTADYTVDSGSSAINVGNIVAFINGKATKAQNAITTGTPVVANAVASDYTSAAALSSTSFVVAYVNRSTGFAEAVVATVSGTTITYGTPVAINAVSSSYTSVAALDSTHFVVAYAGASNFANAVVATVSGTTITAGTPVALNAVTAGYESAAALDSTHFVVAYRGASGFANAVVATVSGTTITAGTPVVLNSLASTYTSVSALSSTSFVVAYQDSNLYADAVVATVSGTTITAGTFATVNSSQTSNYDSVAALDSTHFVVAYRDGSTHVTAVVATVSGTSVTGHGSLVDLTNAPGIYTSVAALSSTSFVVGYREQQHRLRQRRRRHRLWHHHHRRHPRCSQRRQLRLYLRRRPLLHLIRRGVSGRQHKLRRRRCLHFSNSFLQQPWHGHECREREWHRDGCVERYCFWSFRSHCRLDVLFQRQQPHHYLINI